MRVRMRPAPSARNECESAPVLAMGSAVRGSLADRVSHASTSCGKKGPGPDRPFRLDLASRSRVRVTERGRGFLPVVHVRRTCRDENSEVGCSSDGMDRAEASFVGLLDAGQYYVFADSISESASGDFVLATQSTREEGQGTAGDTCGEAISLAREVGVARGDTFDARDDVSIGCGASKTPDVVFRVDLLRRARLFARIRRQEGTHLLALQSACGVDGRDLSCGEKIGQVLSPGTYWIVVQTSSRDSFGRFELSYRIQDVTAAERSCASATALTPGTPLRASITGAPNHFMATCAGPADAQRGPDRVHTFTVRKRSKVQVQLRTDSFQPVMSVRRGCTQTSEEVGCWRASRLGQPLAFERPVEAGTYFVIVDSANPHAEGEYTLQLRVSDP